MAEFVGEDHERPFSAACQNAHACLQRLTEIGIKLPTEEIAATHHQLENKEIIVSIHGRHNCGKSTLINALLGHSILPMSILNETGVMVRIKHDTRVHKGRCENYPNGCQQCPKLSMKRSNDVEIQGCEEISKHLQQANNDARTAKRQKNSQQFKYELTLTANVPMLASAQQGWKIVMLDNPGFGESHQEHMTQLAKTTLKTSSAYLVILDVGQLGDEEDERCLKLIHEGDEEAFDVHGRVLIAVTKYDTMYRERKQLTEKEVKKIVQGYVQAATGSEISNDAIVTVCGKWALSARLLQCGYVDEYTKDEVEDGLKKAEVPRGQTEDLHQKAVILEGKTGIEELERRVQKMMPRCVTIWIDTMTTNYHRYIKAGLDLLAVQFDETNKCLRDTEAFREGCMTHYTVATDTRANIQRMLQKQSEVYKQLCMSADDDVKATKGRVMALVQDFGARCQKMIAESRRVFGEFELKREIERWLNDEVKPTVVVEIANASERFRITAEHERTAVEEVDAFIETLNDKAKKYIEPRPTCPYLPVVVQVEGEAAAVLVNDEEQGAIFDPGAFEAVLNRENPTFEELQQHLDIPPLEIPCIGNGFRLSFHFLTFGLVDGPKKIYRSDTVTEFIDQLQLRIETATEEYLRGFITVVADSFFKKYCETVGSKLRNFDEQLGNKLEEQKKEDDQRIESLREIVRQLEAEKKCLERCQSQISEKAEKFKNSLESASKPVPSPFSNPSRIDRESEL